MVVRVKICGLTRRSDVRKAVDLGADAVGFIFGYDKSPRNLELKQVKELVRDLPPYVSTVLVSPSMNPKLNEAVEKLRPSHIQIYDDGSRVGSIRFSSVIQTVRPHLKEDILQRTLDLAEESTAILLDNSTTSRYSEARPSSNFSPEAKWKLGRKLREALDPFPLILSGGLTPENVADAILAVKPFAVDVSSGVESKPGIKDEQKMKTFLHNTRIAIS